MLINDSGTHSIQILAISFKQPISKITSKLTIHTQRETVTSHGCNISTKI